jgi:PAS domain S-box-containing protein
MNGHVHILLVDDNPDDRALAVRELGREFPRLEVYHAADLEQFKLALEGRPFDLVVTDQKLQWSDGLTVLLAVKARWPDCPVIMFTGSGNEEIAVQAMKAGLDDYVLKSPKHYVRLPAAAVLALDRARQRRAHRETETRYERLFNRIPVGLFRVAFDGRIIEANPSMIGMLGFPDRESLLSVGARRLFADLSALRTCLAAIRQSGVIEKFELRLRRVDGGMLWVETNARAVADDRGTPHHCEGSVEDITARKQAEEKLRDSHEQLRALAAHLQSAREEERARLAREVHDELGQSLAALKMDLSWVDKTLSDGPRSAALSPALEKLQTLPGVVDTLIGAIRRITTALRPPVLDDLGLEAAIEWQIREFEAQSGVKCEFDSNIQNLKLDPERATAVFRIFQDTLTGIVRQARATHVNIHLGEEMDQLALEVRNDGRTVTGHEISTGQALDLLSMRERATMLDGEINVVSGQGKGTYVGVRIPLHGAGVHG